MNIYSPGFDPSCLDMVMRQRDFVIYYNEQPLLTKGGNEVSHTNDRFLRNLLTEIQLREQIHPAGIDLYSLFEFLHDEVNNATDPFAEKLNMLLEEDAFIQLKRKTAPVSEVAEMKIPDPGALSTLVNLHYWNNANLLQALNAFIGEQIHKLEENDDIQNPLEVLIGDMYNQASREVKASIRMLSSIHGSQITLPMLLVMGWITPGEYCKGILSHKSRTSPALRLYEQYNATLAEANSVREFLASIAENQLPEHGLDSFLKSGEGDFLEFKSTLRWDLRAGKTNQAVERACLKTISAFLNTNGGVLLIGVRDDGTFEGIESDRFPNEDKFLLHLWTLIRTCLGRDVSPHILTRLEKGGDKTICVVRCARSNRPVFLRQPGFNEEFYIRVGPGSAAMDISEALKYIADHFTG